MRTRTISDWHPNFPHPTSKIVRTLISDVQAIQFIIFCYGSLSRLIQKGTIISQLQLGKS